MGQLTSDEDYLMHHGVLGMKWGVRKERPSSSGGGSSSREAKKASIKSKIAKFQKKISQAKSDRAYAKKQRQKIKNISKRRYSMSDQELKTHINRLEKQKKLRDLAKAEVSPGRAAVKNALKKYGGQSAGILVATTTGYAIRKQLR